MSSKINFLKSSSKNYQGVQSQLINLIVPHLPSDSWTESRRSPKNEILNITFFVSRRAHILMSHGVADKNYFTSRDIEGNYILNRFQYGFVPGNWLRNRLISHPAIKMPADDIHVVGWPRLDVLTKLRANRPPSDRLRVLWAPTHNFRNRNGRVLSSFPSFEKYLPALSEHFDVEASPHPRNRPDKTPTTEKIAHCDVLISDFGTTVYEALALGIPVIFPDWLIREGILHRYPDSSPSQLFTRRIGHHPENFDEMMDILKSGPIIDADTKAFIDNVIAPHTVGRAGEITARKLLELADLPLKPLPILGQFTEGPPLPHHRGRTLLYVNSKKTGSRVFKKLKPHINIVGLISDTTDLDASLFGQLSVEELHDYTPMENDTVIVGTKKSGFEDAVSSLENRGLSRANMLPAKKSRIKFLKSGTDV